MLAALSKWLRPLRVVDPVFGPLRFQSAGFWEGSVFFNPTQSKVEVLLDGGEQGPSLAQRTFMSELSSNYGTVLPAITQAMEARHAQYQEQPLQPGAESFVLVCIGLPPEPLSGSEWELSFEGSPSGFHYTVALAGWSPASVELKPC